MKQLEFWNKTQLEVWNRKQLEFWNRIQLEFWNRKRLESQNADRHLKLVHTGLCFMQGNGIKAIYFDAAYMVHRISCHSV